MNILAIESSCDETSAAVVEKTHSGFKIKSNIVASQIDIHKLYGGVVRVRRAGGYRLRPAGSAHRLRPGGALLPAVPAAGEAPALFRLLEYLCGLLPHRTGGRQYLCIPHRLKAAGAGAPLKVSPFP